MGRHRHSRAERIENMDVGQSISYSKRVPFDALFAPEEIDDWLKATRSTVASLLSMVKGETINEFKNESTVAFNDSRTAVIATVCVTRTK